MSTGVQASSDLEVKLGCTGKGRSVLDVRIHSETLLRKPAARSVGQLDSQLVHVCERGWGLRQSRRGYRYRRPSRVNHSYAGV